MIQLRSSVSGILGRSSRIEVDRYILGRQGGQRSVLGPAEHELCRAKAVGAQYISPLVQHEVCVSTGGHTLSKNVFDRLHTRFGQSIVLWVVWSRHLMRDAVAFTEAGELSTKLWAPIASK